MRFLWISPALAPVCLYSVGALLISYRLVVPQKSHPNRFLEIPVLCAMVFFTGIWEAGTLDLGRFPEDLPEQSQSLACARTKKRNTCRAYLPGDSGSDPEKWLVITRNNGVMDPFFKGHGDSRFSELRTPSPTRESAIGTVAPLGKAC